MSTPVCVCACVRDTSCPLQLELVLYRQTEYLLSPRETLFASCSSNHRRRLELTLRFNVRHLNNTKAEQCVSLAVSSVLSETNNFFYFMTSAAGQLKIPDGFRLIVPSNNERETLCHVVGSLFYSILFYYVIILTHFY